MRSNKNVLLYIHRHELTNTHIQGRMMMKSVVPCYGSQEAYVPAFPVITGRKELLPQTKECVCVCVCVPVCVVNESAAQMYLLIGQQL